MLRNVQAGKRDPAAEMNFNKGLDKVASSQVLL